MIVNKHNLEIIEHAKAPYPNLKVTPTATIATDSVLLLRVSALEADPNAQSSYADAKQIRAKLMFADEGGFPLNHKPVTEGQFEEHFLDHDAHPEFQFAIRLDTLEALMQAVRRFANKPDADISLRFRIYAEARNTTNAFVQFDCKNSQGQSLDGAICPITWAAFQEAFKE